MVAILYFMIALMATIIGSTVGLGGGIIMKPIFDFFELHNPSDIGIYSSSAIFVMCIVSIYKQLKTGTVINIWIVLWISFGSFIGGLLGETIFHYIYVSSSNVTVIKSIQSFILLITLVIIYLYMKNEEKFRFYNVKNPLLIVLIGVLLSAISVFLGIGGGPMNLLVFTIFFSMTLKDAVVYSLATIFFSQVSKLGQVVINQSYQNVSIDIIIIVCFAAVVGALIGTKINQASDEQKITKTYEKTLVLLMLLVFVNVIKILI
jgi:uncharacterized membrane protein YfcA